MGEPAKRRGSYERPARTVTHSVATMSWIDPNANLPERDVFNWNRNTPANRAILLGKKYYRFANFLEASVVIESDKIIKWGFTG